MDAGKGHRDRGADALPRRRRAQEPAGRERRHEQGLAPADRREPGLPQQLRDLRTRIRPAVAERRIVGAGPNAPAVRNNRHHAARRCQHPPHLAQQPFRIVGHFQCVNQQDTIDRRVRQRQRKLIDQGRHLHRNRRCRRSGYRHFYHRPRHDPHRHLGHLPHEKFGYHPV